jgi:hypothetical protein
VSKKIILGILIVLDVILGLVLFAKIGNATEEIAWTYERESIGPSTVLKYLDWESYGDVAALARTGRIGAKVKDEDRDLYLLGEYADMLFQEKIFTAKGDADAAKRCAERCADIRATMPGYAVVLDKMDWSIENAIYHAE